MVELKALFCLIGAVLINITLGTLYSIGNLNPYIASYMREKVDNNIAKEDGIWITSTFLLGQGIFLILGAYIERTFSVRIACIVGCIIHSASCFLTIWAIKVSYLVMIIIYGFGTGCGAGSAYMATIVAIQRWFPLNKGLFTGVILAGFGFGGLIYTNLQTWYINPDNKKTETSGYFSADVYESLPGLFKFMGCTFVVLQTIGCALVFPPPSIDSNISNGSNAQASVDQQKLDSNTRVPSLPQINQTSDLFSTKIFYIIGIMMALVVPGMTFVNSMGKSFGQVFISDDRFLAIITAIAAIFNSCGRLFWGYLMDRLTFSSCLLLKCTLFILLIVTFPLEFVLQSKTLYTIWMLGLFFTFAGIFVIFPVFIDNVFGGRFSGMAYGILYNFLSLSSILSSFIIPWMMKKEGPQKAANDESLSSRIIPPIGIALLYVCCVVVYYIFIPVKRLEEFIDRKKVAEYDRVMNISKQLPSYLHGTSIKSQLNQTKPINPMKSKSRSRSANSKPVTIVDEKRNTEDLLQQNQLIKAPSTKSMVPATAATKSELSTLEGKNSLGTVVYLNRPNETQEIKKLPAN